MNVWSLVSPHALMRSTRRGEPGTVRPAALGSALVSAALLLAGGVIATVALPAQALPAQALPAAAASLATGDARSVSQPSIPATCATVTASLATSNRQFSSSAESSPPDTSRIQSALNGCAGTGKAVVLAASGASNALLSGPLTVGGTETLVINTGVTLYASRNPANYQVSGKPTCGTVASSGGGCKPFITVNGANAAIMGTQGSAGQGLIDGRGDLDLVGQSVTWWDLANTAKSGGSQNNPRLIQSNGVNNFTVYDLSLTNSPNFHLVFNGGNGFTVWGLRIKTPANARNTDGIDPSGTNVTINNSYVQDGDDGVAVKGGNQAAQNMTIENSHFYGTHGISIGSETNAGVSNILFKNDTLSGTDSSGITSSSDNGMRIKSYSSVGGLVSTVSYEGICMTGVKTLLDIDPFYSSGNGSHIPNYTNIVVDGAKAVSSASSAKSVLEGFSSSVPLGLTLENVSFDATSTTAENANIGTFDTNLKPSGTNVTVTAISGSGSVPSCSFPSFPGV
jgi:polygalacturonase